jgi:hypothetical protein
MTDLFDIQEEAHASSDSAMQRLVAAAKEIIETEQLIQQLEENLSELKARHNKSKTIDLPDMMAECGLSEFRTDTGFRIAVEDFVSGSLPKDDAKRREAIVWLENNGAENLIKTELSMAFGKSEHNEALSLMSELQEKGYTVNSKMGVHPMTLISHIKERLKSGDQVPLETLGLFAGRVAKIKPAK